VAAEVTNPTKISTALEGFKNDITEASKTIDPATGVPKAAQFSVVVIVILNPTKNTDGTIKLSTVATFFPTTDVVKTLDADHQKIYCPIIQKLLANVGGVNVADLRDCTWAKQTSAKRNALQGTTDDETFEIGSDIPESKFSSLAGNSFAHKQTVSFFLVIVLVIMLFLF